MFVGKQFYFLVICFLFYFVAKAQRTDNDAAFWFQFELEKKLSKNWQIQLTEKNKIDRNFTHFRQAYFELEIDYKFNKHVRTGITQRVIQNSNLDGSFQTNYKTGVYVLLKKDFRIWKLTERLMIQTPNIAFNSFYNELRTNPCRLRSKTVLTREVNKFFDLYSGAEIYLNLLQAQRYPAIDRYRILGGITYKVNKNTTLQTSMMLQHRWRRNDPVSNDFIYGLAIQHVL